VRDDSIINRVVYPITNLRTCFRHGKRSILSWPKPPLQQTLKALDKAIKEALDKTNPKKFPVFKNKCMSKSAKGTVEQPGKNV
jgi:hypothetical protein